MAEQFETINGIAAVCATAVSVVALIFTIYTHRQLLRSERRAACFALHQLWSSPHLTEARDYAALISDEILLGRTQVGAHASDVKFIASISHIEHFIVDLDRLMSANVVCPDLAHSLFSSYIHSWVNRMKDTIYAAPNEHSFHPGKDAETALRDFQVSLIPILKRFDDKLPG